MRVADAERIARAGGEPAAELVLGLLAEVTALRERVDEHERILKRDSTNSSLAPSNDPPLTRQQRRALARERAKTIPAPEVSHRQDAVGRARPQGQQCLRRSSSCYAPAPRRSSSPWALRRSELGGSGNGASGSSRS